MPLSPAAVTGLAAELIAEHAQTMRPDEHHVKVAVPKDDDRPQLVGTREHRLGVTPWVRFRDRLDGDARGIIEPLLTLQDRINEAAPPTGMRTAPKVVDAAETFRQGGTHARDHR